MACIDTLADAYCYACCLCTVCSIGRSETMRAAHSQPRQPRVLPPHLAFISVRIQTPYFPLSVLCLAPLPDGLQSAHARSQYPAFVTQVPAILPALPSWTDMGGSAVSAHVVVGVLRSGCAQLDVECLHCCSCLLMSAHAMCGEQSVQRALACVCYNHLFFTLSGVFPQSSFDTEVGHVTTPCRWPCARRASWTASPI